MSSRPSGSVDEVYVWTWVPGVGEPVVAGRLSRQGDLINFNYGRSFLAREEAIALYAPELPLRAGLLSPPDGMTVAGCIADAMPDAWGQRVIMHHLLGPGAGSTDPTVLDPFTYMLESDTDRIGALDFQPSADVYVPRNEGSASLEELQEATARVDEGEPLSPGLDRALLHGSSVGGARPKALLDDDGRKLIAKFSSSTDAYPLVKGEFVAMEVAARAGLDVARVEIAQALGRDVLLVTRFDRLEGDGGRRRRGMVSALTVLGLGEMQGRYASYAELAQVVRERFTDARATLRELFSRIVFNVLVGNTDDHARNHAAFWDGEALTLTPAYDVCPQPRSGGEAAQAMTIGPDGFRLSRLSGCVEAAPTYLLDPAEAREIVDRQVEVIRAEWEAACELAGLTAVERSFFWERQFLNPYAFEGYG